MKLFLDLGAFDGDSIEQARELLGDVDRFYAFEPLGRNFDRLQRRLGGLGDVVLIQAAADTQDGEQKFFLGGEVFGDLAGSLCGQSVHCMRDFEQVRTVNLARFIRETFSPDDEIVLKIDIEGKEYDVLEQLIDTGAIAYIRQLYCEWHWGRVPVTRARHDRLVRRLNKLGFYLTGINYYDEFMRIRPGRGWLSRVGFALGRRKAWLLLLLRCAMTGRPKGRTQL